MEHQATTTGNAMPMGRNTSEKTATCFRLTHKLHVIVYKATLIFHAFPDASRERGFGEYTPRARDDDFIAQTGLVTMSDKDLYVSTQGMIGLFMKRAPWAENWSSLFSRTANKETLILLLAIPSVVCQSLVISSLVNETPDQIIHSWAASSIVAQSPVVIWGRQTLT